MNEVIIDQPKAAQVYIDRINKSLAKTVEAILEVGNTLIEAHENLSSDEWKNLIEFDLPFERRTAEKFMKIAGDKRISAPENADYLPPYWTSLHELTYLDDKQFKQGVADKIITKTAPRNTIASYVKDFKNKGKKKGKAKPKKKQEAKAGKVKRATNGLEYKIHIGEIRASGKEPISQEKALEIEADFNKVCEKHGLLFESTGNLSLQLMFYEAQLRYASKMMAFIEHTQKHDVALINAAFHQLENPDAEIRKVSKNKLHPHDLKHPDNPFKDYDLAGLYAFCSENLILTQYTPIQHFDDEMFVDSLICRYVGGRSKERAAAGKQLQWCLNGRYGDSVRELAIPVAEAVNV